MANPSGYTPGFDFSDFSAHQPNAQQPGDRLDVEFENISFATSGFAEAITTIRRSDGALKNGIVTLESLAPSMRGPIAVGFPVGGSLGQVVVKKSGTDYDAGWASLTTFATVDDAEDNFSGEDAPASIRTEFYDSDRAPMSGALYIRNGGTSGHIVLTLDDGSHVGYDISGPEVSATSFGFKLGASGAVNMAALKAATVATLALGIATLVIPDLEGTATIDTTGGLTGAVEITAQMNVRIDGHVKMSYAVVEANPAFIFHIKSAGDKVTFSGTGTIEGTGTALIASGLVSTTNMPGFIYCEGDHFYFDGIRTIKPPVTAIMFYNCYWGIVRHCEMNGGVVGFHFSVFRTDQGAGPYVTADPDYVGSANFGIIATGGGDHIFDGIRFTVGPDGGRVVNAIFTSGFNGNSNRNKTINCYADRPWEKLLYGYGDGQVVACNTVAGAYGTSDTEAIRVWGSHNLVFGNITELCRGAVQALDGAGNRIFGNLFLRCRGTGINVQHYSVDYVGGIDFNAVTDNLVTWDGAAPERRFAIRVLGNDQMDFENCIVQGNIIQSFASDTLSGGLAGVDFAIEITATSPRVAYMIDVKDNSMVSCGNGIVYRRVASGGIVGNSIFTGVGTAIQFEGGTQVQIAGNIGKSPGAWFLSMKSGDLPSNCRFLNNYSIGATNIGIRNHVFGTNDNYAEGNQWTSKPLVGAMTLAASVTTTVTHGGVASHATIEFIPTSALFAAFECLHGFYAGANSPDFNIVVGDGTTPAGTETARYRIIQ